MYLIIKYIHIACVALSGTGFALRGAWMLSGSALMRHRLTRWVPHAVDSALLASAVALALLSHQYPFQTAWLTAKVLGLLAYIGLGTIALKRGRTLRQRFSAWIAAMAVFAYIVSVALIKEPAGFFAML